MKQLYSWQEECLKKWFANQGRGMIQAVTGSGKTLLALTAASRLGDQLPEKLFVKIVVPTGALMRQWDRALKNHLSDSVSASRRPGFRPDIGLVGAGQRASSEHRYMIYVINSARYTLAREILKDLKEGHAVLLIADECHRYESEQNRLIFEFLPHIKPDENRFFSLGLSATLPSGPAKQYLAAVLGRQIYHYGMKQAASMRTICRHDIYHISLSFSPEEESAYEEITEKMKHLFTVLLGSYPLLKEMSLKEIFELLQKLSGSKNKKIASAASNYIKLAYKRRSLVCQASARISCALELVERLPRTEKIIIFGERIHQAEELFALLHTRRPGKVGRYHSQMSPQANKNALERFHNGDTRILIACKAIDEGLDVPDAAIGIVLSGTSMQRQRIQRLGRILRKTDEKDRAFLYYLHLKDTAEDACFLPDTGESRIFELEYFPDTKSFSHPAYDKAADRLLSELRLAGADESSLSEALRCLHLGCVRSDWLTDRAGLDEKIEAARYVSDKNYWICMKKLGG